MNHIRGAKWLMIVLLTVLVVVGLPAAIFLYNNRTPHISIPAPKMPNPNAWDGFIRAAALAPGWPYCGPASRGDKKVEDWTVADLRADYPSFISHSSAAIAELKRSLRQPYMSPPVRTVTGTAIVFPIYAKARGLARLSSSKALYENALGRPGDAMDSLLDVLELGVTLPKGGPLMAGLGGVAIEIIGSNYIGRTGAVAKLDGPELARAAHRLDLIVAKRTSIGDVLTEEGYASAATMADMFGDSEARRSLLNPADWAGAGSDLGGKSKLKSFWFGSRLAFEDKTAIAREQLAYYQAVAAEQSRGYTGKNSVSQPASLFTQSVSSALAGAGIGTGDLVVDLSALHARAEANLALLQTEIALRRFKIDSGSYPQSLAQLRPKYLKKLPADPFGKKKPLCYKLATGGASFVLYSRGPNMADDGGVFGKWSGVATQGDFFFAAK